MQIRIKKPFKDKVTREEHPQGKTLTVLRKRGLELIASGVAAHVSDDDIDVEELEGLRLVNAQLEADKATMSEKILELQGLDEANKKLLDGANAKSAALEKELEGLRVAPEKSKEAKAKEAKAKEAKDE